VLLLTSRGGPITRTQKRKHISKEDCGELEPSLPNSGGCEVKQYSKYVYAPFSSVWPSRHYLVMPFASGRQLFVNSLSGRIVAANVHTVTGL